MTSIEERLDQMELAIHRPSFRQNKGRANEVNYWVFDYMPDKELTVRERIDYLKQKNEKCAFDFNLVVYDLYDIIIDYLEKRGYFEKCCEFEKKKGLNRVERAISNTMEFNKEDSFLSKYIIEHTPENAIVFLTGIGKCYPILKAHDVLNNLYQVLVRCPVVLFYPGAYNEQELILFNKIKDGNHYRAFRLVK